MAELNMRSNQNVAAAPKKSSDTKSLQQPPRRQKRKLQPRSSNRTPQASEPSLLHQQVQQQANQHRNKHRDGVVVHARTKLPSLPTLEVMDHSDLSFGQQLQHQASLADDDPQLAEMYWYNLGYHQSDAEALQSCLW